MKMLLITAIFLIITPGMLSAQPVAGFGRNFMSAAYEISVPVNNDFLTATSFRGSRFEIKQMFTDRLSVGVAMSFNSFEQYFASKTYQFDDGARAITADMIRQVHNIPITLGLQYYFQKMTKIKTYAGINIGAQYGLQSEFMDIYKISLNNWGFVIRPEVGALAKYNENFGLFVSIAYNYSTNKNEVFKMKRGSQFPITFGIFLNALD